MSAVGIVGTQFLEYFRSRIVIYALVVALFGLGCVAGGIAVGVIHDESRAELSAFLDGYLVYVGGASDEAAPQSTAGAVLPQALRGALLPWLLGLTILGAPVILALVFLRGFALGFTLVFLFDQLSFRGLLLAFVGILPQSLFAIPAVFLASGAAVTFSLGAVKLLAGRRHEGGIFSQLATATLLTLIAAGMIACSVWVQGNVSPVLIETFSGYIRA